MLARAVQVDAVKSFLQGFKFSDADFKKVRGLQTGRDICVQAQLSAIDFRSPLLGISKMWCNALKQSSCLLAMLRMQFS